MRLRVKQLRKIIREAILTPEVADEYLDPDTPLSRKGEIESEYSMGGLGSAGFYRQLRRLRDRRRMQKRRGPAELEESVLPTMVDRIVKRLSPEGRELWRVARDRGIEALEGGKEDDLIRHLEQAALDIGIVNAGLRARFVDQALAFTVDW